MRRSVKKPSSAGDPAGDPEERDRQTVRLAPRARAWWRSERRPPGAARAKRYPVRAHSSADARVARGVHRRERPQPAGRADGDDEEHAARAETAPAPPHADAEEKDRQRRERRRHRQRVRGVESDFEEGSQVGHDLALCRDGNPYGMTQLPVQPQSCTGAGSGGPPAESSPGIPDTASSPRDGGGGMARIRTRSRRNTTNMMITKSIERAEEMAVEDRVLGDLPCRVASSCVRARSSPRASRRAGSTRPTIGMIRSLTSAETTLPTAAPTITPTASANAFVFVRNSLNSRMMNERRRVYAASERLCTRAVLI